MDNLDSNLLYKDYILVGDEDNTSEWQKKLNTINADKCVGKIKLHQIADNWHEKLLYILCDKNLSDINDIGYRNNLNYAHNYFDARCFWILINKIANPKITLLLAYGNCQVHYVLDCLESIIEPNKTFCIEYFNLTDFKSWEEKRFSLLSKYCDFFFYTKESFTSRYRNGENFIDRINKKCTKIALPCYEFRGYFPQTNINVLQRSKYDILRDMYSPFQRADLEIDKMEGENLTTEDIVKKVKNDEYFTEDFVRRNLEISLRKLMVIDRLSDIKIYDYIAENYDQHRMFKDPAHFDNELIYYIAKKLAAMLKLNVKPITRMEDIHPFTEIPIYPAVKKHLRLTFGGTEDLYVLRMIDGLQMVDFELFVMKYINYIKNVKLLLKSVTTEN